MHEIIVMDDEVEDDKSGKIITAPIDPRDIERGMQVIMVNLELDQAFRLERDGKAAFKLKLVDRTRIPKWVERSKADMRQPPEGVYACQHCVPPDTLILGDNKLISEYKMGDTVAGKSGLNEVMRTFSRPYKGDMVVIRANGLLPIITTPEHLILVKSSSTSLKKIGHSFHNVTSFSDCQWTASRDLVTKKTRKNGHYVIIPMIKSHFADSQIRLSGFFKSQDPRTRGYRSYFPLNEDTAWLLGLYVTEGSIANLVRFSLNRKEKDIARKVKAIAKDLNYSSYITYIEPWSSMLVTIPSRVLARAFDAWCGHRAPNKKIPDFVLYHKDDKILSAFLQGYEAGDSYVHTNKLRGSKKYRSDVTTSQTLALQLQLAYARLGRWASICKTNKRTQEMIMGRKCSIHTKYVVSYPLVPNPNRAKVRFSEDAVLSPIRSIAKLSYDGMVHNLATADNTYLISNAITHNCGKWFNNELELSMHTKLHYII